MLKDNIWNRVKSLEREKSDSPKKNADKMVFPFSEEFEMEVTSSSQGETNDKRREYYSNET